MRGHLITRTKTDKGIVRDLELNSLVMGSEVIRNNIEARCQIIQGEVKQNITLGVPIGLGKEDTDLVIMETINNTNGVERIQKFQSSVNKRKYSLRAEIEVSTRDIIEVSI